MPENPNDPVAVLSDEDSASAPEATPVERLIAQDVEAKPEAPSFFANPPRQKPGTFLVLAGVILPSVAIFIEFTTRICAEELFDPLPTIWHKMLVIATPLANLLVIYELRRDRAEYHWRLGLANGLAVVVSTFYTILYLPIMPIALLALVFAGLGILPLSPALSLIASALLLRRLLALRREGNEIYESGKARLRGFGWGLAMTALILVAAEVPVILTRVWMSKAASDSQAERARAIALLRRYGHERTLFAGPNRRGDFASFFGVFYNAKYPVSVERAREIVYRVTGKTYDLLRDERPNVFAFNDPVRVLDETGELRGSSQPNLSLASSRIEGSFDPDAALGYLEWTMVFKNTSAFQQEARARLALPPGGVVSRLTLWVNGEEREAAFAERGKVQAAYDSVVRTRRDPVLVTTQGGDIVNVQCFPVQPNGEMKIRLGVTAPMQIEMTTAGAADQIGAQSEAWMRLPYFIHGRWGVFELERRSDPD
jgi:vault protein inter-alpha-trypsin-like protein